MFRVATAGIALVVLFIMHCMVVGAFAVGVALAVVGLLRLGARFLGF